MASKNVTTGTTSARAWGSQAAVNLSVSEKRRVIIHGLPWAKNQDVAKSQIDLLLASLELDKAWESMSKRLGVEGGRLCLVSFQTKRAAMKAISRLNGATIAMFNHSPIDVRLVRVPDDAQGGDHWVMEMEDKKAGKAIEAAKIDEEDKEEKPEEVKEEEKEEEEGVTGVVKAYRERLEQAVGFEDDVLFLPSKML